MLLTRRTSVTSTGPSVKMSNFGSSYNFQKRRPSDVLADVLRRFSSMKDRRKKKNTVKFPLNVILEDAILEGDVEELSKQVELHGSQILNMADTHARPLLVRTVMEGDLDVFNFFINHGANLSVTDVDGWTALHHIASYDDIDMASDLIKADPRLTFAMTHKDYRPVDLAESPQMVSLLVNGNLLAFCQEIEEIHSPNQHIKSCFNEEESKQVQEVLQLKEQENIVKGLAKIEDNLCSSILHYAAERNYVHLAWLLLQHEMVNVDKQDSWGRTPLHVAVQNGHDETITFLKNHGASMTIKDHDGFLPQQLTDDMFIMDILAM